MSLPVMAWKTGKVLRISGPIASTSRWTGMYLKLAPVPKATHSSLRLILVKHGNIQDYDICVNCSYRYFLATFVDRICNMQEEPGVSLFLKTWAWQDRSTSTSQVRTSSPRVAKIALSAMGWFVICSDRKQKNTLSCFRLQTV